MKNLSFHPNFLGIGAQKAGTTWVAAILSAHPKIYIPRKEIHFFDQHYDLGWGWYEKQFLDGSGGKLLVGEFTPRYMYDVGAADKIIERLPNTKLICILRDPVQRAHSRYRMAIHKAAFKESFSEFLQRCPEVVSRGFYHRQLARFQAHHRKGLLKVYIFENAIREPDRLLTSLADFLGVDADGFKVPAQEDERIGAAKEPRFPRLRKNVATVGRRIRQRNMHRVAEALIKYAMPTVRTVLEKGKLDLAVSEEDFDSLSKIYRNDILNLEKFLDIDLSNWPSYPK